MRISGPYILTFTVIHLLASLLAPAFLGGVIMAGFDSGVLSSPLQHAAALFLLFLHWPGVSILRVIWFTMGLPPGAAGIAAILVFPLNSLLWAFVTWWLIRLIMVVVRRGTNARAPNDT